MRPLLLLGLILAAAAPAFAQEPSVSYTVTIESPSAVAVGHMPIRVRVTGGVRPAESGAYHLRSAGSWSQTESVRLQPAGENLFQDSVSTETLPNETYKMEVRVWSDVPPYDPNDSRTFSRAVLDVAVDNPPPAVGALEVLSPATALRVGWPSVPTSDRTDFLGYRVYIAKARSCSADLAAYGQVAETEDLVYEDPSLGPGDYCVRVAAARESAVSQAVLSPPSAPVKVSISRGASSAALEQGGPVFGKGSSKSGGGGGGVELVPEADPPPVPKLGDGDPVIADGEFIEDLPYGPQTVTQAPKGQASGEEVSFEAGVDPKRTPTLIAGALILACLAGLIQRFLFLAPRA